MLPSEMRERLTEGCILLGLANTYPAPGIIEMMAQGWDFVWVDAQHGQLDLSDAAAGVRACERIGAASVLRVPTHDPGWLGRFADTAATALMVPLVNTVEEARAVVSALRFAPLGQRSFGGRRVIDLWSETYFTEQEPVILAQIETPEAVENVEAIAQIEGIDMLFIGTDDLKVGLGVDRTRDDLEYPELVDAIERTARAARQAGKWCGAVAKQPARVEWMKDLGYQLMAAGSDVGFLRAAAHTLKEMREFTGR